jgi:raffinose/stachyose/melibiose transport system permease protein
LAQTVPRPGSATGLEDRAQQGTPAASPAVARQPRTKRRRRTEDRVAIALFVLPALALFLLLVIMPLVLSVYNSLYKWSGYSTAPRTFIGFDNFTRMLSDEVVLDDLWRGFVLIALSLLLQLPAALGLAMLLNQPLRGRAVYRVLFFAPFVLSEVTTAVLFRGVFSPNRGLATKLLDPFGLGDVAASWLSEPKYVLYSLFLVISWKYFGFYMILYLAGRQNIPKELTEAATTDGAGPWQTFWHVTLPLLAPTIRVSIFLSVIGAIQLFDMVYVLTGGGPAHASEVLAITMYDRAFIRFQFGYASAVSIVIFLISLTFGLLYQRFVLRRDLEGAITTMGGRR